MVSQMKYFFKIMQPNIGPNIYLLERGGSRGMVSIKQNHLSYVFHDKHSRLDRLHRLHAPPASVARPEDAHAVLAAVLDDAVRAFGAARASLVALVDRIALLDAQAAVTTVRERRSGVRRTARLLVRETLSALAADDRILVEDDVLAGDVVVDVYELVRRALHVDGVLHADARRVGVDCVEMLLPVLESFLHLCSVNNKLQM